MYTYTHTHTEGLCIFNALTACYYYDDAYA